MFDKRDLHKTQKATTLLRLHRAVQQIQKIELELMFYITKFSIDDVKVPNNAIIVFARIFDVPMVSRRVVRKCSVVVLWERNAAGAEKKACFLNDIIRNKIVCLWGELKAAEI